MRFDVTRDRRDRALEQIEAAVNIADCVNPGALARNCRISCGEAAACECRAPRGGVCYPGLLNFAGSILERC
jgi:hypothetical protein